MNRRSSTAAAAGTGTSGGGLFLLVPLVLLLLASFGAARPDEVSAHVIHLPMHVLLLHTLHTWTHITCTHLWAYANIYIYVFFPSL